MSNWTDRIVGDRMAVDREFNDRVRNSEFSNQEWGLIMTAVDFEIEDADDPERARIVPDTESLPQMMPELEKVQQGMPGGPGGQSQQDSGTGVFDAIRGALGMGGDDEADRLEAAERLVGEYADALQARLEEKGKWDDIRERYADE
ncbi:DUF5799 family protein [Haloplanus aerogenes]|uniref:Uncharacterized protein n=1 Tax=Haloplanus aerogenes TaxID=660522 RepID=A0A3M0E281_9EURY|nr:DUF5799 family protein [Haloplanus aerogenes]AZH25846.1 hypothetical protein DU502_10865 [Haloplanus aerogenes]RMB25593.1 hypothetical protein ATH50_0690 [Haloplanus aerogenes]